MKCRICGRECPPAAKICRDCASARKRAFAATVTQPLLAAVGAPSIGEPRFLPRRMRRRTPRAANDKAVIRALSAPRPDAALPLTVVPRKHGLIWFVVAAIILVAVLLAIMHTASNGSHVTDEVVPKPPLLPAVVAEPGAQPEQAVVTARVRDEPASEEISLISVAPKPAKKSMPRAEPPPPVAAETVPPPEAAPIAPAPPRVVDPSRQDPLQALNEGLARCAREGFLERMSCEQRLRAQYCGNSWGLVPQCPIGPATDHGQ